MTEETICICVLDFQDEKTDEFEVPMNETISTTIRSISKAGINVLELWDIEGGCLIKDSKEWGELFDQSQVYVVPVSSKDIIDILGFISH
jgi:hypothetical protein